ncbi:MAG: SDR family NAD(P)-dependent oxidoreductase [Chloroflexi bacterium]|nr:SDR family NAD(P)-dependent oxidoreductase [Chloroflexota bacterium]MDA1147397.1 SDR family NAD(P)-dependent oxidoreductase [Chloroflexota bacterium]
MADRLEGRVALVTGAGSGLGRAMARRMAADGAAVMCADINEEGAQDTAAQIAERGGRSAAMRLDVTDSEAVKASLERAESELGGLGIVVNNAGIGGAMGWDPTIGVNLSGVYYGLLHGAQMLAERGGGAIVNIASVAGLNALVGSGISPTGEAPAADRAAAYVASKHGVIGLTRQFAVNFARQGVRVNAICPGYIYTPMTAGITEIPEGEAFLQSLHPMGRLGKDEEIASAAAFLVSDDASFITGVALPVDGGYSAR